MSITNGTIEFSRRVKTGDYEHKDAKVSLSFTYEANVSGPIEDVVDKVCRLAVERALTMVGERALPSLGERVAAGVVDAYAQIAKQPSALVDVMMPLNGADVLAGNVVAENPMLPAIVSSETATTVIGAEAVADAYSPVITSETISDKRLVDELTAKNARLLQAAPDDLARQAVPVSLHRLVAEFVPPPQKVQAIPAEKRAEFLARLAALG